MIRVVTTFSETGMLEYGWRFMDTFDAFWPSHCKLAVYYEKLPTLTRIMRNPPPTFRDLRDVEQRTNFLWRNSTLPIARGLVPTPVWKRKDRDDGYSFRTDAVKFCHKVFAIADAAARKESEFLVWIDADVLSFDFVPITFIDDMMEGYDVAYLGREGTHSECGFLSFRIPQALPMIAAWAHQYTSGEVFNLTEWHDSFVFDVVRRNHARSLRFHNLSMHVHRGEQGSGHPWHRTPLGLYMDHLKGERKEKGYSPEAHPNGRPR